MQTLKQALQDHDMGFFRIISELWGLDIPNSDPESAVQQLGSQMKDRSLLSDIVEALPPADVAALQRLIKEGGNLASGDFFQRYGQLRSMGPGRRDRDKPWRSPISTSERLYYHGLVARAFADSPAGPKEFVFIPDDLLPVMKELFESPSPLIEAEPQSNQPAHVQLANSALLDDATTLLAALRRQPIKSERISKHRIQAIMPFLVHPNALEMLFQILVESAVLTQPLIEPNPEEVGVILATPRNEALRSLCLSWRDSEGWNDFWLLDHLEPASGDWKLDPKSVRSGALTRVGAVSQGQWHSLEQFLKHVKQDYPTFARPGGDFEGWYLRDRRTGNFLRGIEAWEAVDGALLKSIITGPLHWLGAIDLGSDRVVSSHPTHFRMTPWSQILFEATNELELPQPAAKAKVLADGRLILPRAVPRQLRYQVARLCSWQAFAEDRYHYQLKPSAILSAHKQGLMSSHIERLLNEIAEDPIPPAVTAAIHRLLERGAEAHIAASTLLRVEKPAVLDGLMADKSTSRWIAERLNPTTAVVEASAVSTLMGAAVRKGLLVEPPEARNTDNESDFEVGSS